MTETFEKGQSFTEVEPHRVWVTKAAAAEALVDPSKKTVLSLTAIYPSGVDKAGMEPAFTTPRTVSDSVVCPAPAVP